MSVDKRTPIPERGRRQATTTQFFYFGGLLFLLRPLKPILFNILHNGLAAVPGLLIRTMVVARISGMDDSFGSSG